MAVRGKRGSFLPVDRFVRLIIRPGIGPGDGRKHQDEPVGVLQVLRHRRPEKLEIDEEGQPRIQAQRRPPFVDFVEQHHVPIRLGAGAAGAAFADGVVVVLQPDVHDGYIPVAVSYTHLGVGCNYNTTTNLLFSDQSILSYSERYKEKYSCFFDLIIHENVNLNDYQEISFSGIEFLKNINLIKIAEDGAICIGDIEKV